MSNHGSSLLERSEEEQFQTMTLKSASTPQSNGDGFNVKDNSQDILSSGDITVEIDKVLNSTCNEKQGVDLTSDISLGGVAVEKKCSTPVVNGIRNDLSMSCDKKDIHNDFKDASKKELLNCDKQLTAASSASIQSIQSQVNCDNLTNDQASDSPLPYQMRELSMSFDVNNTNDNSKDVCTSQGKQPALEISQSKSDGNTTVLDIPKSPQPSPIPKEDFVSNVSKSDQLSVSVIDESVSNSNMSESDPSLNISPSCSPPPQTSINDNETSNQSLGDHMPIPITSNTSPSNNNLCMEDDMVKDDAMDVDTTDAQQDANVVCDNSENSPDASSKTTNGGRISVLDFKPLWGSTKNSVTITNCTSSPTDCKSDADFTESSDKVTELMEVEEELSSDILNKGQEYCGEKNICSSDSPMEELKDKVSAFTHKEMEHQNDGLLDAKEHVENEKDNSSGDLVNDNTKSNLHTLSIVSVQGTENTESPNDCANEDNVLLVSVCSLVDTENINTDNEAGDVGQSVGNKDNADDVSVVNADGGNDNEGGILRDGNVNADHMDVVNTNEEKLSTVNEKANQREHDADDGYENTDCGEVVTTGDRNVNTDDGANVISGDVNADGGVVVTFEGENVNTEDGAAVTLGDGNVNTNNSNDVTLDDSNENDDSGAVCANEGTEVTKNDVNCVNIDDVNAKTDDVTVNTDDVNKDYGDVNTDVSGPLTTDDENINDGQRCIEDVGNGNVNSDVLVATSACDDGVSGAEGNVMTDDVDVAKKDDETVLHGIDGNVHRTGECSQGIDPTADMTGKEVGDSTTHVDNEDLVPKKNIDLVPSKTVQKPVENISQSEDSDCTMKESRQGAVEVESSMVDSKKTKDNSSEECLFEELEGDEISECDNSISENKDDVIKMDTDDEDIVLIKDVEKLCDGKIVTPKKNQITTVSLEAKTLKCTPIEIKDDQKEGEIIGNGIIAKGPVEDNAQNKSFKNILKSKGDTNEKKETMDPKILGDDDVIILDENDEELKTESKPMTNLKVEESSKSVEILPQADEESVARKRSISSSDNVNPTSTKRSRFDSGAAKEDKSSDFKTSTKDTTTVVGESKEETKMTLSSKMLRNLIMGSLKAAIWSHKLEKTIEMEERMSKMEAASSLWKESGKHLEKSVEELTKFSKEIEKRKAQSQKLKRSPHLITRPLNQQGRQNSQSSMSKQSPTSTTPAPTTTQQQSHTQQHRLPPSVLLNHGTGAQQPVSVSPSSNASYAVNKGRQPVRPQQQQQVIRPTGPPPGYYSPTATGQNQPRGRFIQNTQYIPQNPSVPYNTANNNNLRQRPSGINQSPNQISRNNQVRQPSQNVNSGVIDLTDEDDTAKKPLPPLNKNFNNNLPSSNNISRSNGVYRVENIASPNAQNHQQAHLQQPGGINNRVQQRNGSVTVSSTPSQGTISSARPDYNTQRSGGGQIGITGRSLNNVGAGPRQSNSAAAAVTSSGVPTLPPSPSLHNKHPAPFPQELNSVVVPNTAKLKPPKPSLKISKVVKGIVLSWNMPPLNNSETIASYQLYAYQESSSIPSPSAWKKVGDVKALPLPMACTLTQFQEGNKYYFAVRAVDIYGRWGDYSDPSSIHLHPDTTTNTRGSS